MQLKTCLILFCTIAVLFAELNNGTTTTLTTTTTTISPTTKKFSPVIKQKITTTAKPILVGGRKPWDTKITPKYQKIFNDYKNITLKKLQEVHKVPASFVPKPDKFSTQVVAGINYLYLVKLPTNKYAFVSIYDRPWKKGHYGKEENVQVRPQAYELNDKIV